MRVYVRHLTKNDLGSAVVPRGHHRGVVLVLKCGVAKVDNFNVGVLERSLVSFLRRNERVVRAAEANDPTAVRDGP